MREDLEFNDSAVQSRHCRLRAVRHVDSRRDDVHGHFTVPTVMLMKGIDLSHAGKPERSPLLVTKTLLFGADRSGLLVDGAKTSYHRPSGTRVEQAGTMVHEIALPASTMGVPMTYMIDGRQYIVVATGARGTPAELVALVIP